MTNKSDVSVLRDRGLSVAVHNDYRLNGEPHTFWLFTDKSGMSYKGEGKTDDEALAQVLAATERAAIQPAGDAVRDAQFNGFDISKLPPILISCVAKLWPGSDGLFWELAIEKMPERIAHLMAAGDAAKRRRATDAEIAEWVERHCLERGLSGSGSDNRAAFEDAESLHMTFTPAAPVASAPAHQHRYITYPDGSQGCEFCSAKPAQQMSLEAERVDAARLDFMMRREAWIAWSKDGESCRLFHRSEDGEPMPMLGWGARHWSHDPREAIDAAIAALATQQGDKHE